MLAAEEAANLVVPAVTLPAGLEVRVEVVVSTALAVR
jgi:hypothetical protein